MNKPPLTRWFAFAAVTIAAALALGGCGNDSADTSTEPKIASDNGADSTQNADTTSEALTFAALDCEALDPLADDIARAADQQLFVGPDLYTFESTQECSWSGEDGISFEVADARNKLDSWESRDAYEAVVRDNALPDELEEVEQRLATLTDLDVAGYTWGYLDNGDDDVVMMVRWAPEPGEDSGAVCQISVDAFGADVDLDATVEAFSAFCSAALEQATA
ncbi:hypothetical protein BJ980_003695 [Nocardioides daedukensis]|uniref:DUF3558 domain-containing protein n=1 Tax=Nocardioides daedukensis TaxID=634462 RepID=A0A7Y9S1U6_9ACTN|nr:hypothetical protein [Nocardioides daedukensis]NYG60772.1 hypothetical protein [Nocardioides daedukensis]